MRLLVDLVSKETMRGMMERGNVLPDARADVERGDKANGPDA